MAQLLAVNAGSSSLKLALFGCTPRPRRERSISIDRIGEPGGRLRVLDGTGRVVAENACNTTNHEAAFRAAVETVRDGSLAHLDAIGHRVVRGTILHDRPRVIDATLLNDLRALVEVDPDHTPQALSVIAETARRYPNSRMLACFDSAFHRTIPPVARLYALPRELSDRGIIRFGFHGLSCESIVQKLGEVDPAALGGRLIVAHLGSGASLTAIASGKSVDTTMGFSPTSGIVMSTRSGDLDPSVILYLQKGLGKSVDQLRTLLNQESGLLGVSGLTGDMRTLLERERSDDRAAAAVSLFCYTAKKQLSGLVAVLGGIDTLVFTGGIGEHSPTVRHRICESLDFLGIDLDAGRNERQEPIISTDRSRAVVRVMATDEESIIATHLWTWLSTNGADDVSV